MEDISYSNNEGIYHPDYNSPLVPESVKVLRPVITRDRGGYFCLYGSDPLEGVAGYGSTPEEAMRDFDNQLKIQDQDSEANQ